MVAALSGARSDTRRRVAAALVAILGQADPATLPDEIRADPGVLSDPVFLAAAEHHRVSPAVYVALQHAPETPPALLAELARHHHEQVFRHTAALGNLMVLGRALDAMDVRWAVLKGPHLASYVHARPDLRTYLDLDVVVDHRQLPRVVAALEGAGQVVLDTNWTLIREGERAQVSLLLSMGTPLDLHWHLLNRGPVRHAFHLDMDAILDRAVRRQLGPVKASVLDDEDALIHLALHASLAGGSRLVWVHDIHSLVTRHPLDFDVVSRRALASGSSLAVAVMLQRAAATFGTTLPVGLLDRLASPYGWRLATHALDRIRPVETGYGRAYMGRTLLRATRTDSLTSIREFRHTAARNAWRRVTGAPPAGALDPDEINPLYLVSGDVHDRDAFFAMVAGADDL